MPLSAGLTWRVEGEKTEERALWKTQERKQTARERQWEGKSNLESRGRRFFYKRTVRGAYIAERPGGRVLCGALIMKIPLRSFVECLLSPLLVALLEGLETLREGTWLEAVGQQGNPGLQSLLLLVLCEVKQSMITLHVPRAFMFCPSTGHNHRASLQKP